MEILDALLCLSPAMAPAHLMLLPGFQRRWGSIYDALAAGRVNRTRIEDLLAQYPLESGEAVYACDTSTWVKNDAETSPRRGSSPLSLRNSLTGLVCCSAGCSWSGGDACMGGRCRCGLFLFPPACTLDQVDIGVTTVVIRLRMRTAGSACPTCGHRAHQVQSRYTRHLADVSCFGKSVHLVVQVRRFWCRHPDCPRHIFAERLGPLAEVYARRTTRLCDQLRILGFACGAALGARVARHLALPVSPTTLLRLLRSTPCPRRLRRPKYWVWMIFPGAAVCAMARSYAIWNSGVPWRSCLNARSPPLPVGCGSIPACR